MRLIITEKNDAAKKIAGILSGNGVQEESYLQSPLLLFTDVDGEACDRGGAQGSRGAGGLPARVLRVAQGGAARSSSTRPSSRPRRRGPSCARSRSWPVDATSLIIATDFDREGELIGLEALNLAAAGERQTGAHGAARTVLRSDRRGDQAGLLPSRPPLGASCPCGRGAAGYRPHLGGDAHPLRVFGHRRAWAASSSAWAGSRPPPWC